MIASAGRKKCQKVQRKVDIEAVLPSDILGLYKLFRHGVTTFAISSIGLLPADLLKRISEGDKDLFGTGTDYQLQSEFLSAFPKSWLRLGRLWKEFQPIRENDFQNLML